MMNNKQHSKLEPELRFPEFEGEWDVTKIQDIAKVTTGNKDTQDKIDNGKYPFFVRSQTIENINSFSFDGEAILTSGDGVGVGKIYHYIIGKFDFHQRVYCLYDFDDDVAGKFAFFYFSEHFYRRVMQLSAKNSVDSVRRAMITEMPFYKPSLQEQQKIAATLTSLDTLIAAENEKLEALKAHKKGLLQQLFPAKGEKVPKVRFGEFSGEWEEKRISRACEKPFSGGTPRSSNENYYGGEIPFIRSAEIDKNETELFLTQLGYDNSSAKIVKKGDVLIALYGANSGDVAISKIKGAINQAILCLRSKTNNEFLYQYLTLKKEWIISTYLQGGQGNLSGEIIKSVELYFPQDKNEQQKIANCLSSLDDLITAQFSKIQALKEHKKGLMQQLFP